MEFLPPQAKGTRWGMGQYSQTITCHRVGCLEKEGYCLGHSQPQVTLKGKRWGNKPDYTLLYPSDLLLGLPTSQMQGSQRTEKAAAYTSLANLLWAKWLLGWGREEDVAEGTGKLFHANLIYSLWRGWHFSAISSQQKKNIYHLI